MCQDLTPQTGWKVASRSQSVRLWDDALGANDPYRSLIADTLLRRGNERWVLDAKYKRSFGNEDRNDRFQMCAYAVGFRAKRATLVYPFSSEQLASQRTLLNTTYGCQHTQLGNKAGVPAMHANEDQTELKPVRAAQYVRMSTEHQQYSTANQDDIIQEYATL